MSYCQTLLEVPVPPPMDQVPWFCVCSRCKASVGPKGDRGDRGLPGDQGLEGAQGEMGPQGEAGTCPASCESVQGRAGQPGIPGPAGARGLPGVAGPPGTMGTKGETGNMGAPGVPGMDGEKAIQSSFTAALDTIYPPPDKPVPFTQVITNRQFHFDPIIGIYRAPVNGTYVFSYHLMVFSKVLKVGLFHNFTPVVKTTEPAQLGTASNQVVLHLVMGDRVWLQVKDNITNGMYADQESRSTFSGFLLYPDSSAFLQYLEAFLTDKTGSIY
uniref:Otolin-1 n=1 Tax=Hucho hucho TaxID=62062 RepID=A0A4W5R9Q6_9TELE